MGNEIDSVTPSSGAELAAFASDVPYLSPSAVSSEMDMELDMEAISESPEEVLPEESGKADEAGGAETAGEGQSKAEKKELRRQAKAQAKAAKAEEKAARRQARAQEKEAKTSEGQSSHSSRRHKRQKKYTGPHGSFRAYMVIAFSMVSAITAVLIISIVAVVFNVYFTTYRADNVETIAKFAASRIAYDYERVGNLNMLDYNSLVSLLGPDENTSLMVFDNNGNSIYDSNDLLSSVASAGGDTVIASDKDAQRAATLSNATQVAVAEITPDGRSIGTVRIWVYGSDGMMSKVDLGLRDSVFEALFIAGLIAVLIAILIGFWFSHTLISPIKRIADVADEIANGNFSARTGIHGRGEIGRLGDTFDTMADSIERDRKLEMRLTSDVAHELRTPLMAIQATVEAMQDGVYETDAEHLALVNGEVRRLSRLVDALLKLSRLEMRSQPMNEEICDLGELAETIVASHELFAKDSGLRLKAHVNDRVKAYCDRDMIRQAVANLISNAVRYTPEGGRIDVYVRRDGDYAAIDVADTGIGLTPEEERMVFSRFWRADAGRARENGGLGIGLAVVKEIITRHGGKVGVRGVKDVGATFTLLLPLYNEEQSQREARAALKAFEKRQKFDSEVGKMRQVASGAIVGEDVLVGDKSGGKVPGEVTPGMTGEIRIPDGDELIG